MIKSLRDAQITDGLPRIVREQPWVKALSMAAAVLHKKTMDYIDGSQIYTAIDSVAEPVLDALAVNWKIDWYDTGYDIDRKRRIVKTALTIRRTMGTVGAVRAQADAIYPGSTLEEWFEYLPMLLCDHVEAERALALQFGLQLLEQSEVLLICGDRISRGMKGEIHHAAQLGIPIIVYCEDLYLDVRKLATQAGADKKLVTMDETHPALASNEPGADRSWEVRCLA